MTKKNHNYKQGMTIMELVVVLAIFAVLSMVVIFSYPTFQAKVDIVNLANDTALQVVQAQNSSLGGLLPPAGYSYIPATWKPSYGVYFDVTVPKQFIYFTDLDNTIPPENGIYDGSTSCSGECISKYTITKNNYISCLDVFYTNSTSTTCSTTGIVTNGLSNLAITFSRPSSGAVLKSTPAFTPGLTVNYVQITVVSPQGPSALIELYPSGRVQIN